jgi:hypothetical protein
MLFESMKAHVAKRVSLGKPIRWKAFVLRTVDIVAQSVSGSYAIVELLNLARRIALSPKTEPNNLSMMISKTEPEKL